MDHEKVYAMSFGRIYPLLVAKAEKKGRTQGEVNEIICWLTGYSESSLARQLESKSSLEAFFASAPEMNPNAAKITGVACGVRVEEIADPLMQKIRWLDKLIDELAKGKTLNKIMRG